MFALEDCQRAIEIDSSYSKAYGRMGLAYASLNDHAKAKQFYEKAIELDPNNESFRNNLRIAEEKAREMQRENPLGSLINNMNLDSIMQNPAIMNFAQRMMGSEAGNNNLFSSMMNSFGSAAQENETEQQPQTNQSNIDHHSSSTDPSAATNEQGLPDLTPFFRA